MNDLSEINLGSKLMNGFVGMGCRGMNNNERKVVGHRKGQSRYRIKQVIHRKLDYHN